ncbi:TIGR04282 family arsenosugar biosynthesis glycosyltransferase [Gordonia rhizosphera]|uniref:Glycosyltransferase n=1 Tax=Gordonia rhizosphera NBRC 16068 TaxID=1108045 RepID=K6WXQ9_9ACTN|nr:DUF2064 domain-containing protein [Gordonia rhizosphera]GAB91309.1 hypothetical protein GORHZ_126_00500 [Gordonia rhizosphera NBRC 16068]
MTTAVLVVAKSPVPGEAKTRLIPRYGPHGAAELAAAALLDTVRIAGAVPGARVVVACRGHLGDAVRTEELAVAFAGCAVIGQRGNGFGERLANAHRDAVGLGAHRVVQIGMDTPQVTAGQLAEMVEDLDRDDTDAILAPAGDGGWWALGLRDGRGASVLPSVPMSRPDTGALTERALRGEGLRVRRANLLDDVDVPTDVDRVAVQCPADSEFARTAAQLGFSTDRSRHGAH